MITTPFAGICLLPILFFADRPFKSWLEEDAPQKVEISAITWDAEFVKSGILQTVQKNSDYLRWEMSTNPACAVCQSNMMAVKAYAQPAGWSFGDGGHFTTHEVPLTETLPKWQLKAGDHVYITLTGRQDPKKLLDTYLEYHGQSVERRMSILPPLSAGKIDRETLENILEWLGPEGEHRGSNKERVISYGSVDFVVPENMAGRWSTDSENNLTLRCSPNPYLKWSIFTLPLAGAVYDGKTVRGLAPFSAASPVWDVVNLKGKK